MSFYPIVLFLVGFSPLQDVLGQKPLIEVINGITGDVIRPTDGAVIVEQGDFVKIRCSNNGTGVKLYHQKHRVTEESKHPEIEHGTRTNESITVVLTATIEFNSNTEDDVLQESSDDIDDEDLWNSIQQTTESRQQNVTFEYHNGWYHCLGIDTKFWSPVNSLQQEYENVSSVYVSVNSSNPDDTFAGVNHATTLAMKKGVNNTLVYNCLTTLKKWTVKCIVPEKCSMVTTRYKERFGCVFEGNFTENCDRVTCAVTETDRTSRPNVSMGLKLYDASTVPQPQVRFSDTSLPRDHNVKVGEMISLKCHVNVDRGGINVQIYWSMPASVKRSQLVYCNDKNKQGIIDGQDTLCVKNTRVENTGDYVCTVKEEGFPGFRSHSLTVRVIDPAEPFVSITSTVTANKTTVNEFIPNLHGPLDVSIYVDANPDNASLTWYGPGGVLVPTDADGNYNINQDKPREWNIRIKDCDYQDSGAHVIEANAGSVRSTWNFTVKLRGKPELPKIKLNASEFMLGDELIVTCVSRLMDKKNVIWDFKSMDTSQTTILANSTDTVIEDSSEDDFEWTSVLRTKINETGHLRCIFFNDDSNEAVTMISVQKPPSMVIWLSTTIALIVVITVIIIYLVIRIKREKMLQRILEEAGLAHFEEGALECINPELTIGEQAELLPYDRKWEYPKEKLRIGKQLGSGAFGVVMKAEARGICESEESTTVAVKMVRVTTEPMYIKALASELKIMVHLGKHLNVVNLLGACTKDIGKRELYVIVEYCRYGNLHNYLYRHRSNFVDQLDPETRVIHTKINTSRLERLSTTSSKNGMKYVALNFARNLRLSSVGSDDATPSDMADYRMTADSENENESSYNRLLRTDSIQPGWRSNYTGDYKETNLQTICTKDLICWSWQVARGMEYLSGRKILHGDLAARNILLADDDVVKICDFGLAKSMYKDNNYQKKGNGPVPVKWMAIEAIRDGIFSTQSDVWSFGVVLWEFFTLARTPYHDMDIKKQCESVANGYRLEQPRYAPKNVYDIMKSCWMVSPKQRPTFAKLATLIGNALDEETRTFYLNLNTGNMEKNSEMTDKGRSDYLMMSSAPDHAVLSSPTHEYVNVPQFTMPDGPSSSSYIPMAPIRRDSTVDIFSPRISPGDLRFEFPSTNVEGTHRPRDDEEFRPEVRTTNRQESWVQPFRDARDSCLAPIKEESSNNGKRLRSISNFALTESEKPSEEHQDDVDPNITEPTTMSCSNPGYAMMPNFSEATTAVAV